MKLRLLFCALSLSVLLLTPSSTPAQGCAQCRDNTAAAPPATQRAYRHAIVLLAVAGGGLFAATIMLFKRQP